MDNPRQGRKFELICPICRTAFSTDNKKVKYCSRECTRNAQKAYWKTPKGRAYMRNYMREYVKTPEAQETRAAYLQKPETKEQIAKYHRDYRKRRKR